MDLLRHLRYFVAVAEELHFGRAAARLHMAQPPLSQRIQGLERELGVRLLERSSRHVALTPAGRLLLDEARELLAHAERVTATMERVRAGELGEVRAGVPPEVSGAVLAEVVGAFRAACPEVRLELRELTSAEQLRALAAGELDIGVVRHPIRLGALERGAALARDVGVLVPEAGAPERPIELSELRGRDLVLLPREAAPELYDELLATCRAHGFVPRSVHQAANAQFAAGLVLAGDAVFFGDAGAPVPPGVAWRPLAGAPLRWRVSAVWRPGARSFAVAGFAHAIAAALTAGGWRPAPVPDAPARRVPRPSSGLLA